jgi:hypothetical protein
MEVLEVVMMSECSVIVSSMIEPIIAQPRLLQHDQARLSAAIQLSTIERGFARLQIGTQGRRNNVCSMDMTTAVNLGI